MSCMKCDKCGLVVDTDFDVESLYVMGRDCLCEDCREPEFNQEFQGVESMLSIALLTPQAICGYFIVSFVAYCTIFSPS